MDGRCQRCWGTRNLANREVDANPRSDPTVRREKIVLCRHCSDAAPTDPPCVPRLVKDVPPNFGRSR